MVKAATRRMKFLVIEDDATLADSLKAYLESKGHVVDCVYDGDAGQRRIDDYHSDYDLIILDWMLPQRNGIQICRSARQKNIVTPILMLTARGAIEDKIEGLDCGADDYLTKPFVPEELWSRIKAVVRRPPSVAPASVAVRDVVVDQNKRKVLVRGKEVHLTLKEFALLEYLMLHRDSVLSREQIFTHVWDWANNAMSNVVDVHMHSLRKKLGGVGKTLFETVPGVGYRLRVPS